MSSTPRLDAATRWRVEVQAWQAGGCVGDFPQIDWPVIEDDPPPPPLFIVPRVAPPPEALKLIHFKGRIRRARHSLTKALLAAGALTRHQHRDEPNPPIEESA